MATNHDDTKIRFTSEGAVKHGLGLVPMQRMKLQITTADLTAAATTDTVDFASTLPDGSLLMGISYDLIEVFAGGSVTACVVDLGDGTNADRFIDNVDIFTGATTGFAFETADTVGDGADTGGLPLQLTAATTFRATVTSTTDDVDQLTTGILNIYLDYYYPQDPTA